MIKEIKNIFLEYLNWLLFRIKYDINYDKIVVILTGENEKVDASALDYIEYYASRKSVNNAIIFISNPNVYNSINVNNYNIKVKTYLIDSEKIRKLYHLYCFYKYYDNIVFTYTSIPSDNLLNKVLEETNINERDIVCLALYHLRKIPNT